MQSVSQGTWLFLSQRVSKWLKLDWLVVLPGICITNRLRRGLKVELKSIEAAGLRPDYLQVSTATLVLAQICCFPLEYGGPHSLPTPVLIAPVSFFSVESHELLCVVPRQKILNGVPSACEISGSLRIVCSILPPAFSWKPWEVSPIVLTTQCFQSTLGVVPWGWWVPLLPKADLYCSAKLFTCWRWLLWSPGTFIIEAMLCSLPTWGVILLTVLFAMWI